MFCVITGITVVFASDTGHIYNVAVRPIPSNFLLTFHRMLIGTLDCRLSGRGSSFHYIGPEHLGLSKATLCASSGRWFHSSVYGDCRLPGGPFIFGDLRANDWAGRVDLLFRIEPSSLSPWIHRLVRSQQGTAWVIPEQPTAECVECVRQSSRDLDQPNAPDVYLGPTQRLRNTIPRVRIPWRSCWLREPHHIPVRSPFCKQYGCCEDQ